MRVRVGVGVRVRVGVGVRVRVGVGVTVTVRVRARVRDGEARRVEEVGVQRRRRLAARGLTRAGRTRVSSQQARLERCGVWA